MDNETEPHPNGGADGGDGSTAKQEESKPATMRELFMRLGAVGNVGIQAVNVVLAIGAGRGGAWPKTTTAQVGKGMLYGSSAVGAVNSPVVVYKERQLTKEDTFRTALNGIREEQGRLTEQNDVLTAEIDDLQSEVDRMKDVELALRELANVQGTQLNELMDLVKENKEINEGMRAVLKSKCLEEVISLVLDIDNDGSFTIQNKEIDRLIIGMNLIEEISFESKMFRQAVINCDGNVDEVISLIKTMIHGSCDGDPEGGNTRCTIEMEDPEQWFQRQRSKV
mmetsp:Transcript_21072/g.45693  ORF Transcript_21072/g.45693 Transcript_21072/m.45693 type:complete len:281 (-) Transcript_21072:737-1579(-)|eukprot:CAMPEP_0172330136 /NCGR_PEP_ID=MMETSP1058-20130122/61243_1 /TAXON_ID=83371 /ORGANISM="Detonula confervacea, Strain CCMP 353" /LENGTH=280 /DNA_ID=CAMNT_0013047339 /DNA_START=176 /DNA_END=1018 /DNA_ORIENTATION=-